MSKVGSFICRGSVLLLLTCCSCGVHDKLATLHMKEGEKKYDSQDYAGARDAFADAIKQNPKLALAYTRKADSEFALKAFPDAIRDYTEAIGRGGAATHALVYRGLSYNQLRDFAGAISNFDEAIRLEPSDAEAYRWRGVTLMMTRQWEASRKDLDKAIELDSDNADGYRNRAAVELALREYESAIADATEAIRLNGDDSYTYHLRAQAKLLVKDFENAVSDYDKAIEMQPSFASHYAGRASAMFYLNQLEKANADVEKTLRLDPTNVFAIVMRGLIKEHQDDYTGALADFNYAVSLKGLTIAEAHAALGLLEYNLKQWDAALKDLRKALDEGSINYDLRFNVWLMEAQSGRLKEADNELQIYLDSLAEGKVKEWPASIARFLLGKLGEEDFFNEATNSAPRLSAIKSQTAEAFFYAGMKRKLAGDKQGAIDFFQKCVDTRDEHNFDYISALFELRELTGPKK